MEQLQLSYIVGQGHNILQVHWEKSQAVLYKTKDTSMLQPKSTLLAIYPSYM